MRTWISLLLVIVSQLSLAKNLDLRNLQIKIVDQQGQPATSLPVTFDVSYFLRKYDFTCYFSSPGLPTSSGPCLMPYTGKTFSLTTSSKGIISFGSDLRYNINYLRAVNPAVTLTFGTGEAPKCHGLNYFKRSADAPGAENLAPYVYDDTVRITLDTLKMLKEKNTNEIFCQY
ncbi:MAG: hypothetical protein JNL11_16385 [Bdellovibrionaceae bacterium]|nr:hypothetical protein [Pseudobdellovibrionaceae bacterium]